jgi:hypothetical protein
MTPTQEVQEKIRRYLLGQLSDEAREGVEREFLADEEFFSELLIIEDEITDEYVNGRLNPEDRAQFENHFLATPERYEDLQFAQALNRYVSTAASRREKTSQAPGLAVLKRRRRRLAAALAVAVIMIGTLWFFVGRQRSPTSFLSITLNISSSTRGDGVEAPTIEPLGNRTLRVFLRLPSASAQPSSYGVRLLDTNGETTSLKVAAQDAQSVTVEIPASQLRHGRYALNLVTIKSDGSEERIPGSYYFNVP